MAPRTTSNDVPLNHLRTEVAFVEVHQILRFDDVMAALEKEKKSMQEKKHLGKSFFPTQKNFAAFPNL